MQRQYDYACGQCGHEEYYMLTLPEYETFKLPDCALCGTPLHRVYIVNTPKYRQMKGRYNSLYNEYKDVKDTQSKD